ncbi:MAG: T9SS type A sorting domain-containing protein [Chitinophagaceae bacterium]|nr:T9SS type A sorting domain-containing protein [Chitinophagaceae bacterium]
MVGGHACKKISVTYYQYSGAVTHPPSIFTYQENDTVFYYNILYSKYFPLYIFNVSQGDTLVFHSPIIPSNPADTLWQSIIDSVTNFVVDNDTLEWIWTTEPNLDAYSFQGGYIEKLGCPFLMLHQPHAIFPEWDGPMRCYNDSEISFNFNTYPCDYLLTNGINENKNQFGLFIFPNPASYELNVQTKLNREFRFSICNSFGQLMNTGILQPGAAKIPLSNYSNGLYSIELNDGSRTERQFFPVAH